MRRSVILRWWWSQSQVTCLHLDTKMGGKVCAKWVWAGILKKKWGINSHAEALSLKDMEDIITHFIDFSPRCSNSTGSHRLYSEEINSTHAGCIYWGLPSWYYLCMLFKVDIKFKVYMSHFIYISLTSIWLNSRTTDPVWIGWENFKCLKHIKIDICFSKFP